MLAAGLPVGARGQHGGTPLRQAAWHGNAEMVNPPSRYRWKPPMRVQGNAMAGPTTVPAWWHRETGDYAATIEALRRAGSVWSQTRKRRNRRMGVRTAFASIARAVTDD